MGNITKPVVGEGSDSRERNIVEGFSKQQLLQ